MSKVYNDTWRQDTPVIMETRAQRLRGLDSRSHEMCAGHQECSNGTIKVLLQNDVYQRLFLWGWLRVVGPPMDLDAGAEERFRSANRHPKATTIYSSSTDGISDTHIYPL